ncbi:MAG: L-gulono,4-lactone dehydrogenase [Candidatus Angelobacter sp.]|nr:L-gulono,4-lactone dehydrogenase [Candidatus Angelobacter sp.]
MPTRREFLVGTVALYMGDRFRAYTSEQSRVVNDIHSGLNRTRVSRIAAPKTSADVQRIVRQAKARRASISIAGGRHAMGGQQFGTDTVLIDMRELSSTAKLDAEHHSIEASGGAFWPRLINNYLTSQEGTEEQWGIAQKQTGADNISIAGTLAANAHGRGLHLKPFVSDVESFTLINADGELLTCNRRENPELFKLAIGGYGMFGVVSSVTLRLVPRQKIQRIVEIRSTDGLMEAFNQRIRDGFLYGDFQFALDPESEDFLHRGVFSCYKPLDPATVMPEHEKQLSDESWRTLLYLAHENKSEAFKRYTDYYMSTNEQLYWSDLHQLSFYPEHYHRLIDQKMHAKQPGSEMITEINVPRDQITEFLAEVREDFRRNKVELIYGTVRLIEKDEETFLPWAKQPYACTIFNLHAAHTQSALHDSAEAFRRLIDIAIRRKGTYYLTYHKYARKDQVLACYPNFPEFLSLKRKYDPQERFQSDWYRHYKKMFASTV